MVQLSPFVTLKCLPQCLCWPNSLCCLPLMLYNERPFPSHLQRLHAHKKYSIQLYVHIKEHTKKSKSLAQYVSPASTLAWGHVWVPLQGHISSSLVTETNFGHWCWCQSQKHSSTCSYKTEAENQQIHDLLCCAEYLSSINTGRLLHRN